MTIREYLSTADVSELTGIPVGTLRYWRHRSRGEGPVAFHLGRRVIYKRSDVEAWIAINYQEATA